MPLPATMTWPPTQLDVILPAMRGWDAWYANRTDRLAQIYAQQTRPAFEQSGLVGAVRRFFWGASGGDTPSKKLHLPIAADICQASADLLFATPPTLTVADDKTQARLDLIIGADAHDQLASAAEVGAALGGTFMRVAWDQDLASHPFLTRVDADRALPEFRWGRLAAVTFWRIVEDADGSVWRHLERHEQRDGIGIIEHGLYKGTAAHLGRRLPLDQHSATRGFAAVVDADGIVSTLTPGLDVVYVPNQSPNRAWRDHPLGANLGRSDLDGIEPLLDALDETWSSWMRDIRLGKARIVAAQSALNDHGPGKGATLDLDREVYEAVNTPPSSAAGAEGLPITQIQFKIRVAEHQQTAEALLQQVLQSAGYSAQTFGADSDGAALTATEVRAREARSFTTRKRKIRAWRPALAQLAGKALAIDQAVFRGGGKLDETVTVDFGDSVQDSQEVLASTAQALFQAQAASTKIRVQMMHPDWSEQDVDDEVTAIRLEFGEPAPDPDDLGRGGFGLSGDYGSSGDDDSEG
ncbi:phage portal protein [Brachybacterium tyrofermentans]|uniref:phage portal protein n=1 Tax=Brachybacterium tyrofermentans TaxID=47848 RepID=UPI001865C9C2|nr:phage portal protein [Brachybacterium tyrofermentans]